MDVGSVTLETLFTGVNATKYSTLASLVFLLYDHVLTFVAEVDLVWNSRWSFGKVLFIVNRYFGLCTLFLNVIVFFSGSLTDEFCEGFFWWEGIADVLAILNAEIILQTRVYAVFGRNKALLAVMVMSCIVETASTLLLVARRDLGGFKISPVDGLTGCYATGFPKSYFFTWIPVLVFETILCFIMVLKIWKTYRQERGFPLLHLIVRDSILYFFTIFVVLLVNCLVWALAPQVAIQVALGWVLAVPCAAGSRLLLNMRERYYREETELWENPTRIRLHIFRPGRVTRERVDIG